MVADFLNGEERTLFLQEMLLDRNEPLLNRGSAAIYLGHDDSDNALQALVECACNDHEDSKILTCCGDAIAEIWDRNKNFDIDVILGQVTHATGQEIRNWLNSK
ncbi:MAG: hypothetical protein AUJ57_06690 [Zetaproteobacteria bacterium CG1_02_53_45]|nr:MAG: hypothetical protein AUJ57_06690 [Zetaproteobacteria bacterium CG1_02_53_45]